MKLPMKWLADFTDVGDIDIKEYCDRMTATGSKVEGGSGSPKTCRASSSLAY